MLGLIQCNANNENDNEMLGLIPRNANNEEDEDDDEMPGLIMRNANNVDEDEVSLVEASDTDVFVAEIMAELEREQEQGMFINCSNLPERVLDDIPEGCVGQRVLTESGDLPTFPDVPAVLVDDDDSICYPCSTLVPVPAFTEAQLTELEKERQKKKNRRDISCGATSLAMASSTGQTFKVHYRPTYCVFTACASSFLLRGCRAMYQVVH